MPRPTADAGQRGGEAARVADPISAHRVPAATTRPEAVPGTETDFTRDDARRDDARQPDAGGRAASGPGDPTASGAGAGAEPPQPHPQPATVHRGRLARLGHAFVEAGAQWFTQRCSTMSAALAFFAAFSLAPMLVVVIAIAGFFYGSDAVQGRLFEQLRGLVGPEGATAVQAMVRSAWKANGSALRTVLSGVTILVGATATFAELREDLNVIWRVPPAKASAGIVGLLRTRLLSLGMVMTVGFLLVVSLVLDTAMTVLQEMVWSQAGGAQVAAAIVHQLASFLSLWLAFTILMKFLPLPTLPWRQVVAGAAVAALLFVLGRHFFGLYLSQAGTANAFGAAGSLAVILMWLFYSAAVFLFGAEFSRAWWASRPVPAAGAQAASPQA